MTRGKGGAWLPMALLVALGCKQAEPTAAPGPECNAADDCNDMFGGSTVREHSDRAATFAEVSGGCPHAPEDVPPLETLERGALPEFDASRDRASNMNRGDERLQDIDLHASMMTMQPRIFACVDLASCYEDGAKLSGNGELEFDFELRPNGTVAAVSVHASPGLDHPSVVACARRTMAEHRFPGYDGGQMMINYVMTIEAVADE
ncbi:hypothetical protein [Paraliomyxa miuraensis]|uniref:hypothetical protein n=1 Tax=Paraliomyxa miuraensis TaxID=376150 RepID=UPI002251E6D1|nr:hypothetical protein [Paraliomyxa miuraensis]MCX4247152.1 hypothetical protein [Paraliomyxa miuraensis]